MASVRYGRCEVCVKRTTSAGPMGGHSTDRTSDSTGFQVAFSILVRIMTFHDERLVHLGSPCVATESREIGIPWRDRNRLESTLDDIDYLKR
jgi:hypothetical protein